MRSRARNKARIEVLTARLQKLIDAISTAQRAALRTYCEGKLDLLAE